MRWEKIKQQQQPVCTDYGIALQRTLENALVIPQSRKEQTLAVKKDLDHQKNEHNQSQATKHHQYQAYGKACLPLQKLGHHGLRRHEERLRHTQHYAKDGQEVGEHNHNGNHSHCELLPIQNLDARLRQEQRLGDLL
jgi:hypothetical protein